MPLVGETEEPCLGLRCLWSERLRKSAAVLGAFGRRDLERVLRS